MTRLLADLEKYEGQRIAVKGYFRVLGPGFGIYPTEDLALIGDDASAIVVYANVTDEVTWEALVPCINNYVRIFGEVIEITPNEYFVIGNLRLIWSYSIEEAKRLGSPQMVESCLSEKD